MSIATKIKAAIRKNGPEIKALISGRLPKFVYGADVEKGNIPVFVFHEVTSGTFESHLIFLKKNGYTTIDGTEFYNALSNPKTEHSKKVVLTFDDGHISLWTQAYSLLKKYDMKVISFICPGLVPDTGNESEQNRPDQSKERKLCNWQEIQEMHRSGCVDFQSHGLHHDLVFRSSKLIDFYSPHFTSPYLGKGDEAVILQDGVGFSITNLWPYPLGLSDDFLGMPIFEHAPRMSTPLRYHPSQSLIDTLCDHVQSQGGRRFFLRTDWKHILNRLFLETNHKDKNKHISGTEYEKEVIQSLSQARALLSEKLLGKEVFHFCFPWYAAMPGAEHLAQKAGYEIVYYGLEQDHNMNTGLQAPFCIFRLSSDYLFTLPASNRISVWSIWSKRVGRLARKN